MKKTIAIDINEPLSYKEIKQIVEKNKVSKGDSLLLISKEEENTYKIMIVLLIILAVLYYSVKKKSFGEEVIEKLFGKYNTIDEAEKAIETEFGIQINVKNENNNEIDNVFGIWNSKKISIEKIRKKAWRMQ